MNLLLLCNVEAEKLCGHLVWLFNAMEFSGEFRVRAADLRLRRRCCGARERGFAEAHAVRSEAEAARSRRFRWREEACLQRRFVEPRGARKSCTGQQAPDDMCAKCGRRLSSVQIARVPGVPVRTRNPRSVQRDRAGRERQFEGQGARRRSYPQHTTSAWDVLHGAYRSWTTPLQVEGDRGNVHVTDPVADVGGVIDHCENDGLIPRAKPRC